MKDKAYYEDVNIKNELKLRDMIQKLPKFCMDFFIGIDADKSSRTKIAYAYDLQTFFEYMKSANPSLKKYDIRDYPISLLDQISPSDIEEYLFYLKYYEKDGVVHTNDERGIKRKLASLRTFYNFYFRKEFIDTNPASKVTLPKIHEKNIIRLDTDEVAQLLDEVESGDSLSKNQQRFHEKTKVRDLALMTLLLGTGIRVSECVGLDMDDVDFKNNGIKVHRKGGADVIVYFGDEVRDALLSYWEERSIITPAEGHANALFLSLQRKRISVRSVENLVKKYSRLVTTVKNITPHKLRSTYGTTLYQETGDIYLVADVLGHTHARILEGYRLMMKSLKDYQDKSGMWNQLIDKADCWPETSGSAMFTYAMIMGVKKGWLDAEEYGPIARKAWIALVPYINKDGDVEEVCVGTGKKNDLQYYYDRPRIIGDYHGQAPMLWCTYALLCK